jgi:hypothetical protein
VHRYNVAQVSSGKLRPAVQIAVKPMDAMGFLTLFPLLEHQDPLIRHGVAAMLRQRYRLLASSSAEANSTRRIAASLSSTTAGQHWSEYQWATDQLLRKLVAQPLLQLSAERTAADDRQAIERMVQYTMQWY